MNVRINGYRPCLVTALVAARRTSDDRCAYCGCELTLSPTHAPDVATVDHITPKRLGGTNVSRNLLTVCRTCNCSKGGRTLERWLIDMHAQPHHRRNRSVVARLSCPLLAGMPA
jgi:5-methylcytosine-specific restriction endonuclease McrA